MANSPLDCEMLEEGQVTPCTPLSNHSSGDSLEGSSDVHISPIGASNVSEIWFTIKSFHAERISIFMNEGYAFVRFTTPSQAEQFIENHSTNVRTHRAAEISNRGTAGHNTLNISPIDSTWIPRILTWFTQLGAYKLTVDVREATGTVSWPWLDRLSRSSNCKNRNMIVAHELSKLTIVLDLGRLSGGRHRPPRRGPNRRSIDRRGLGAYY